MELGFGSRQFASRGWTHHNLSTELSAYREHLPMLTFHDKYYALCHAYRDLPYNRIKYWVLFLHSSFKIFFFNSWLHMESLLFCGWILTSAFPTWLVSDPSLIPWVTYPFSTNLNCCHCFGFYLLLLSLETCFYLATTVSLGSWKYELAFSYV